MSNRAAHRAAKSATNVYRGYMPEGLPQHKPPNRIKPWWKVLGKPRVTLYPKSAVEGFSEEPEYPPLNADLNDGTKRGTKNQIRLDWYESLKASPTVETKLLEIGRHCDHYMAHINNWLPIYNSLPMAQYLTQTNLIKSLPDNYKVSNAPSNTQEENSSALEQLKDDKSAYDLERVKEFILGQIILDKYESIKGNPGFVSKSIRDGNLKGFESQRFVQNLVSGLRRQLALEVNPQLVDYQYDLSPAIRSWWYHSGFEAPNNKTFFRSRKDQDGSINQWIQMNGSSALNIRSNSLMEPIISQTHPLVTDTQLVEKYRHPLKHFGARFKFTKPVALAGFWFEDEPKWDFPHTCFLTTDSLSLRNQRQHKIAKLLDDNETCLTGQAILTGFGWLNSLSMYHGFTPFQELDYPFTGQLVTTDGKNWLFNIYQLNSHTFHRDMGGIRKNNICWTSGMMQLYENYENGRFEGVNDEVVKLIIRFMAQKTSPVYTSNLNLRPYLGLDTRGEEKKNATRDELRRTYEQRKNRWLLHDWKVPLYEHIFFRSKQGRNRITHMKARYHIPKVKYPKIFE